MTAIPALFVKLRRQSAAAKSRAALRCTTGEVRLPPAEVDAVLDEIARLEEVCEWWGTNYDSWVAATGVAEFYAHELEEGLIEARADNARLRESNAQWAAEKSKAWRRANELKRELEEVRRALRLLVALKDGPRDDRYHEWKPEAWENARRLMGVATQ